MPTGHAQVGYAASMSFVTLVTVNGESGALTGLGLSGAPDYHNSSVYIDGNIVIDDAPIGGTAAAEYVNTGLPMWLPFDKSLEVAVRDATKATQLATYWATFVTDHSEMVEGWHYLREDLIYRREQWDSPEGGYAIDGLVGPRRTTHVTLDTDVLFLDSGVLEGDVEVRDHVQLLGLDEEEVDAPTEAIIVFSPVGRTGVAVEQPVVLDSGVARLRLEVTLPRPGEWSLRLETPGCTSLPTSFTAL